MLHSRIIFRSYEGAVSRHGLPLWTWLWLKLHSHHNLAGCLGISLSGECPTEAHESSRRCRSLFGTVVSVKRDPNTDPKTQQCQNPYYGHPPKVPYVENPPYFNAKCRRRVRQNTRTVINLPVLKPYLIFHRTLLLESGVTSVAGSSSYSSNPGSQV